MFNGIELVEIQDDTIKMTQEKKIEELQIPKTEESFRSQRALAQYISVNCRPNICATVQLIALVNTKVEERQFKSS